MIREVKCKLFFDFSSNLRILRVVIYRLLSCGGAEVYKLSLPVGNKSRVANLLTFVFVGERNVSEAQHLIEFGIMCLRPEFIGDYILKVL